MRKSALQNHLSLTVSATLRAAWWATYWGRDTGLLLAEVQAR